jgi:hypothetical protein
MRSEGSPSRCGTRGQATVEYAVISAAFFGFTVMGWPFLTQLLNALHRYFVSIYYVIQSPVPCWHGSASPEESPFSRQTCFVGKL